MTRIAKIIELIGSSDRGWTEGAQGALDEAKKTIKEITGLEVNDITASVDPSTGTIKEYKVGVKIAFGVEGWALFFFVDVLLNLTDYCNG